MIEFNQSVMIIAFICRFHKHDGNVKVHYKHWSMDEEWLPKEDKPPLQMFRTNNDGTPIIPTGIPPVVVPDYEKKHTMAEIKSNISVLKKYLSFGQYEWWENFLIDPDAQLKANNDWYLQDLNQQETAVPLSTETIDQTISPLSITMEKERAKPEIYTGKKTVEKVKNVSNPATPTKKRKVAANVGYMIGYLKDEELVVGKVCEVGQSTLSITVYNGTINGEWQPGTNSSGEPYKEVVAKSAIREDFVFALTQRNLLPGTMKDKFRTLLN